MVAENSKDKARAERLPLHSGTTIRIGCERLRNQL